MKYLQLLSALILILGMSGCTQYWYQPGVSFEKAQADHRECFKAVLDQSTASSMTNPDMEAMKSCMAQKGYDLVFGYQLPKAADRINPISSPHWKLNGVAGLPKAKDYPLFEY